LNARESQQIQGITGGADLFLAQPPLGIHVAKPAWQGDESIDDDLWIDAVHSTTPSDDSIYQMPFNDIPFLTAQADTDYLLAKALQESFNGESFETMRKQTEEDEVEAQMLAQIERESFDLYEQQQQQANSQKLMEECGALMYNRTQMAWLMRHEACDLDRLMFAWIIHRVGFMQGKDLFF